MAAKPKKRDSEADDILKEARDAFALAEDAESHNRTTYVEDVEFSRESKQWPEDIKKQRDADSRPCLTINKMPAFIRQVVNDARQNKPSIKVHPADSGADPEVAEIYNGLIRNIEYSSNADIAYDTATECAVSGGWGYIRVKLDYAYDDTFDLDISIDRVANPLSIYGDPNSSSGDSGDWDTAFAVEKLTKDEFEAKWGDKAQVDWDDTSWDGVASTTWKDENTVMVAEWWRREKVDKPIVLLSNGVILGKDEFAKQMETDPIFAVAVQEGVVKVEQERITKTCKVTQHFVTGAEVLQTREWPGKYIPIIPVYGDEFDIKGKRFLRSLIHNAKDAQRMVNFWRTNSTELVALAPRVPYIGEEGAFDIDERWNSANTRSHSYLEVTKGKQIPQRQPLDMGVAAGSLQEALNASDDMKAIIGLHDASLGARSNETSGRAIMARQREGDVATFHFIDNMARAIRHTGRVVIDLIPKVYNRPRIVRVMGEDGTQRGVAINQETQATDNKGQPIQGKDGQPMMRVYDLAAGKYDLTVTTGPSFTTRREEAAYQITEAMRAMPDSAPILMKHLAKNLDWPGADEIAKELEGQGSLPPEIKQAIEDGKQKIAQLEEENAKLKQAQAAKIQEIQTDAALQQREAEIDAQTEIAIAHIKAAAQKQIEAFKAKTQAEATVRAAALKPAPQPAARA
jgi:hypothetical protein